MLFKEIPTKMNKRATLLITHCLIAMLALMFAQTDEIQVYDGEIAPPGIFNLMIHKNFTPKGRTVPDYSGAIIIESGVGYGLTAASDKWTLNLTLSRNLNVHPWHLNRKSPQDVAVCL